LKNIEKKKEDLERKIIFYFFGLAPYSSLRLYGVDFFKKDGIVS